MPALGHILFFRGDWLYFIFGLLTTVCFLAALQMWLARHSPLPFWQFLSLCTCSFVIYQFEFPGYPDILAFLFFLLVISDQFTQRSKVAALTLALVTHEASMFVGIVLAWRYLKRRYLVSYMLLLGFYGFVWLTAFGFSVDKLLSSHNLDGLSGIQWLFKNPRAEALGIFVAFKGVWLLIILAVLLDIWQRQWERGLFVSLVCSMGVGLTFLAVDTSRMVGWAFPGALVSLEAIRERLAPRTTSRVLSAVFCVNLVVPSFYVGLKVGGVVQRGIYSWVHQLMSAAGLHIF